MDLHTILIFLHIAGTILGVGGATLAEVFYISAVKDGGVDASEKRLMHANYTMIRVGTLLVALSGFALVLWWYFIANNPWPLESGKVWVKNIILLVIVVNAILLSRRLVPFWLGASLSFTSWWGAALLGVWKNISYSFTEILIGYIAAIFIIALILGSIRKIFLK